MRGSRKFCQRGFNSDNVFLVVEGIEDPNANVPLKAGYQHGVSLAGR